MYLLLLSKITARRIEKNYSQSYMASQLKISQGYYNKLENGKIEMSVSILFEIVEILDMDIIEVLCNTIPLRKAE